jgi:phosphonate transport system substrate-binding protein
MELDENAVPKTLIIGIYVEEGPETSMERYGPIGKYLEKKLGMKVEYTLTSDYTAVIEAIRAKKIHVAYLPPFSYVLAKKKMGIDVMVTTGINGKPYHYKSAIITGKNSGIKSMDDVKKRAKNLTLCFPDPASASGHLIPRAYLKSIGLDPKNAFKETLFASGHIASVMTVKSGKMDLGCTAFIAVARLVEKRMIKEGEVIVLWVSDPIVADAIVIRSDINKEFARKVKQAYLDVKTDGSDAWNSYLENVYGKSKNDSLTYIVSHDSLYNGIRKIVGEIEEDNLTQ